jgi:hypothetical protein
VEHPDSHSTVAEVFKFSNIEPCLIPIYEEWHGFLESLEAHEVSPREYGGRKRDIQYKGWLLGMRFPISEGQCSTDSITSILH